MDYKRPAFQLLIVLAMIIMLAGLLAMDGQPTAASPALQPPTDTPTSAPPPTNTPVPPPTNTPAPPPTNTPAPPPTDTPVAPPTNTPAVPPTNTPVVPQTNTPVPNSTNTPAPANPPKKGGGGGAPPGPSGTPTVNGCVLSIGRDGIGLSTDPGFYQAFVQTVPRGEVLLVLQGPVRADTIWWWRLRTATGVEGWGSQDNITPDPGPCNYGVSTLYGQPGALAVQSGQAAPATQAQSAQALPTTGNGMEWVLLAALLAAVLIVAATWRRRLQTQTTSSTDVPEDDEDKHKP